MDNVPYDPAEVTELTQKIVEEVKKMHDDELVIAAALRCANEAFMQSVAIRGILAGINKVVG